MITEERADDLLRSWAQRQLDAAPDVAVPVEADVQVIAIGNASQRVRTPPRTWLVAASVVLIAVAAVFGVVRVRTTNDHTAANQPATIHGTWRDYSAEETLIFGDGVVTISGVGQVCGPQTYEVRFDGGRLALGALRNPFICSPPGVVIPKRGTPEYNQYRLRATATQRFGYVVFHTPSWRMNRHVLTLTAPNGTSIQLSNTLSR